VADKRPAFQFYPKDYLADELVALMTLEQEGAYVHLLSYCWLEGSIPADSSLLARLCRVPEADMERIWVGVEKCFRRSGERYTHPRLDLERQKQDAYCKAKSDAGKAGAKAKHEKDNSGSATVLPVAESSFAVCCLQSSSASATETTPPVAPQRPPNVENSRHAELAPWLGTHADCLTSVDLMAQRSIWGIWGPHGTEQGAWKGMATDRQPPILATAILSWTAAKPERFYRPYFASILERAIDDAIASDRQEDQRRTEGTTANESREQARRLEEAEIARLNAEALKTAAPAYREPPTKHTRISGLEKISA